MSKARSPCSDPVEVVLKGEDGASVPIAEGVEHLRVDEDAEGNVRYCAQRCEADE
jgi:hypothetical protein